MQEERKYSSWVWIAFSKLKKLLVENVFPLILTPDPVIEEVETKAQKRSLELAGIL